MGDAGDGAMIDALANVAAAGWAALLLVLAAVAIGGAA